MTATDVTGVPVGRIAPVPPSPSLLTSARALPEGSDWQRGVAWNPVCDTPSHAMPFCPADPTRELSADRAMARAVPFLIYTPMVCDLTTVDVSDVGEAAEELTDVHTAFQIASAAWMGGVYGAADTGDVVTFRNAGVDINPGDVYDLDDGVAALLGEYETCTQGSGGALLHIPSTLSAAALGGASGGARVAWPEGNFYRGPNGSVVVPGPGYPLGTSADGPDGYGPLVSAGVYQGNDEGQSWVYVTGPIEYAVTPVVVVPEEERDRIPFRTNRYEVWGQRQAIVRFDPCCVFAARVSNPVVTAVGS